MVRMAALVLCLGLAAVFSDPVLAAFQSHLGVGADDLVTLHWQCNTGTPTRLLADGTRVTNFTIPRRNVLVITDVEVRATVPAGGTGEIYIMEAQLQDNNNFVSTVYFNFIKLVQLRGYSSDHLTSGLVLDSTVALNNDGATPSPRFSLFGVSPGNETTPCEAILRGYLLRSTGP